mmetsp:Transcript_4268/g.10278  ORF Transcript_4268/g.10278 Transcript_4268/m.10278 type:complete len:207 (-) Transcript_4268:231-851(-)
MVKAGGQRPSLARLASPHSSTPATAQKAHTSAHSSLIFSTMFRLSSVTLPPLVDSFNMPIILINRAAPIVTPASMISSEHWSTLAALASAMASSREVSCSGRRSVAISCAICVSNSMSSPTRSSASLKDASCCSQYSRLPSSAVSKFSRRGSAPSCVPTRTRSSSALAACDNESNPIVALAPLMEWVAKWAACMSPSISACLICGS